MGRGKLILFMGTTPNIGTTVAAFGTAVRLSMATQYSLGYLCLNLKSSKIHRYLGLDEPVMSLDNLRAELKSRSLRPERLKRCCEVYKAVPNLYVLFGNMQRDQAEMYSPDDIDDLLEAARDAFDICIVEVNAYWDNAATVCGVLRADSKIAVTSKELTHFQEDTSRWLKSIAPVFGIHANQFKLVITLSDKLSADGFRIKDIQRETGMSVIGEITRYADVSRQADQGKILDLFLGDHPMNKELMGIADTLIEQHQWERKPEEEKKTWMQRLSTVVHATRTGY